ncbi:MAG TPA: family 1 glycosylhydrolase [Acidimicrobiia bacterium]|nr:family 1 glycosylhydrolase [Acidimicrobiia bacterium]
MRLEVDEGFVVATGIECSAPMIACGVRQDELRKTGHWERFDEDLAAVASFGIRYLRYGVPFHVVAKHDDSRRFDWQWIDRSMGALQAHGIEPILDLLHFGLPDDIRAVGDPRLPGRYEAYAAAVAERYPWVRYYTPVNEPFITAWLSAMRGLWNERRRDDVAFVAALDNVVTCVILGMRRISERRPDAIFVQSDACESYRALDPGAEEQASFLTERGYVAYDLTYGRRPSQLILHWLHDNGMSDERLAWFAEHGTSERCIIGHDYYRGNERLIDDRGRFRRAGPQRRGFQALALDFHARYDLPFMLCETNIAGTHAPGWLAEVWNDALDLKDRGLPIRGFCWYGFVDHVDWDTLLTRNRGKVNTCGLVGQDRRPHAVGQLYRQLATAALDGRYPRLGRRSPSGAVSLVQ